MGWNAGAREGRGFGGGADGAGDGPLDGWKKKTTRGLWGPRDCGGVGESSVQALFYFVSLSLFFSSLPSFLESEAGEGLTQEAEAKDEEGRRWGGRGAGGALCEWGAPRRRRRRVEPARRGPPASMHGC
jgi:hypothetical protein